MVSYFYGHLLPGSFFILFGVWGTVLHCCRYVQCLTQKGETKRFWISLSLYCPCSPNIPVDIILKLSAPLLGICGESVIAFFKEDHYDRLNNAQHICMYFFFALYGFVELLLFLKAPLPKDSDYVTLTLAFVVEALLFRFHLHGQNMLHNHIHMLLVYVVIASAMAVLLSMRYRHNVHAALTTMFCILLQGTWFIQIAFIMDNPIPGAKPWDGEDHQEMMLVTSYFAWHMIGIVTFVAFVGFITWWILKPSTLRLKEEFMLEDDSMDEQSLFHAVKEIMIVGEN